MNPIAQKYGIPDEVASFIDDGTLALLSEKEAEKTVTFHIPALRTQDRQGRFTTYTVYWIHPDFNDQFCHYYEETPGDLPNFWVEESTDDVGDEILDDCKDADELAAWLADIATRVK